MSLPAALALTAAIIMLIVCAEAARRLVRQSIQTKRTWDAAFGLVELHQRRLDDTADQAARNAEQLLRHGIDVTDSIEELQHDIKHARWLFTRIPEAREDFRRALIEYIFPPARRTKNDH